MSRLAGVAALLCGALGLVQAQETRSEPPIFFWGSASNASLTLTVGSATGRALLVTGVAGTLGSRDRAAMVGAGVAFLTGAARTRLLLETLLGSGGWTGRLVVATASEIGQGSVFAKVHLSHPLEPGADPPEAQGIVTLHARLRWPLRWGAFYDFDAKHGETAQHHLGPSLQLWTPRGALILGFGRGLGGAANEVCVTVRVTG